MVFWVMEGGYLPHYSSLLIDKMHSDVTALIRNDDMLNSFNRVALDKEPILQFWDPVLLFKSTTLVLVIVFVAVYIMKERDEMTKLIL